MKNDATLTDDKIIGSFGLKYDNTVFTQFENVFSMITGTNKNKFVGSKESFFYGSTKEDNQISINHFRMSYGLTSIVFSRKDKVNVIAYLVKGGHLNKRGAVAIIGEALSVTRSTVYKYIKQI